MVTRKTDQTCATAVVMKPQNLKSELPLDKPVTVSVDTAQKGTVPFSCPMDMIHGKVTVD